MLPFLLPGGVRGLDQVVQGRGRVLPHRAQHAHREGPRGHLRQARSQPRQAEERGE